MEDKDIINQIAEERFQTEDREFAEEENKLIDLILNRSNNDFMSDWS